MKKHYIFGIVASLIAIGLFFTIQNAHFFSEQSSRSEEVDTDISDIIDDVESAVDNELLQRHQSKTGIEIEQESIVEEVVEEVTAYKGSYFAVEYPSDFIARPDKLSEGVHPIYGPWKAHITDEAWFSGSDGLIEFYVYSPLWYGEPDYVNILETEEQVSEKIVEEEVDGFYNRVTLHYVTVQAKNGSYFRSFVNRTRSIVDVQGNIEQKENDVFGIRYANAEVYDMYKDDYIAFKSSLQKFAD